MVGGRVACDLRFGDAELVDPALDGVAGAGQRVAVDRLPFGRVSFQQDLKTVESRYGDDVLHLVIASGYLAKLTANRAVKRYLTQHHPEILEEFTTIVAAASLDQASTVE